MAGRNTFNLFFHEEFTEDVVKDQIVPNVVPRRLALAVNNYKMSLR